LVIFLLISCILYIYVIGGVTQLIDVAPSFKLSAHDQFNGQMAQTGLGFRRTGKAFE
jgi:hypothetical protein